MPVQARPSPQKLSGYCLQGYATRYGLPHIHDGQIEMFTTGAMARALATKTAVQFLIDHDESLLVATAADRLELFGDEKGLAFRLRLADDDAHLIEMVKSGERDGMSVGYRIEADEWRTITGERVKIITDGLLCEISLVKGGPVRQAFASVVDASQCGTLAQDCKAGRLLSDGSTNTSLPPPCG
jgi:HK97 family phage prohead protease